MSIQESYEIIHENCGSLLFVSASNETPKLISEVEAAKLLGKISLHPSGMGGGGSYQIPKQALESAGLNADRWEKAVEIGLLLKHGEGAGTTYELPVLANVGQDVVPTTLIANLEAVSGITHTNARRIATKHPGRDEPAANTRSR